MKRALIGMAMAASVAFAAPAMAESYKIDGTDTGGMHAVIGFKTKHLGYSWLHGRFDKFTGTFKFDEANPEKSNVTVDIDTTSLNTNHGKRDEHLRSADFFNTAKFPSAKFESTEIKVTGDGKGTIKGNLTMLDVTKPVEIAVEHIGGGKDPWGGFRRGFSGSASIVPADFGMPHAIAKQTVYLTLDIEGIRQ